MATPTAGVEGASQQRRPSGAGWRGIVAVAAVAGIVGVLIFAGDGGEDRTPASGQAPPGDQVRGGQFGRLRGTLSANELPLLGAPRQIFDRAVNHPATGRGLRILSVAGDGFFVGTTQYDRVFVRQIADDPRQRLDNPRAGARVDFFGDLRPLERSAAELGLRGADARTVEGQGAFVAAESVSTTTSEGPASLD